MGTGACGVWMRQSELAMGVALLTPLHLQIDRYAQRDLKKGLHLYGTPGNVGLTNAWSIIQTDVSLGVCVCRQRGWGCAVGGGGRAHRPAHQPSQPLRLSVVSLLWGLQLHRLVRGL